MLVKEIDRNRAEVKLYGNIGGWFANGDTFSSLLDELEAKGYKDVVIRMHCYGGSVFEGNVIYNALQRTRLNVSVVIDGVAASMGCFILPALENVEIADNGFGMVHRPSGTEDGDADDHLSTAKLLRDMEGQFIKRLSERSGMTGEEIKKKWFDGKDHWLNADEMVQYGFAKKKIPATAKNIKILDTEIQQGLTAEAAYNRYAAFLNNQKKSKMNPLVTLLVAAFALEGITAESSEADVVAALNKKIGTLTERISTLEADAKAKLDSSIAAMITASGVKDEKQIASFKAIGEKAGVEVLASVLPKAGKNQTLDITSLIKTDGSSAASAMSVAKDWDWYQEHAPQALEKMQLEDEAGFRALYKAKYGVEPA